MSGTRRTRRSGRTSPIHVRGAAAAGTRTARTHGRGHSTRSRAAAGAGARVAPVSLAHQSLSDRVARLSLRVAAMAPGHVSPPRVSIEAVMAAQLSDEVAEAMESMEERTRMLVAIRHRQLDMRRDLLTASERPATASAVHRYVPRTAAAATAAAAAAEAEATLASATRARAGARQRSRTTGAMSQWRRNLFRSAGEGPVRDASGGGGAGAGAGAPRRGMRQYLTSVYQGSGGAGAMEPEPVLGLSEPQLARLVCTPIARRGAASGGAGANSKASGTGGAGVGGAGSRPDIAPLGARAKPDALSCCICLHDLGEGDVVTSLTCLHTFHSKCVKQWLRRKNCCPLCMAEVVV